METDHHGRTVRYAEQQFEKGFVLHVNHDERTGVFRKPGQPDQRCTYTTALSAESRLKSTWGGQIVHRGTRREAEGIEAGRLLILELRDAHTRLIHGIYEGGGQEEREHLRVLAETVLALGTDLTTAAETALRATTNH